MSVLNFSTAMGGGLVGRIPRRNVYKEFVRKVRKITVIYQKYAINIKIDIRIHGLSISSKIYNTE